MTSFQRFRRDVRSRTNSEGRSSVRKGSQRRDPIIHDLMSFSSQQIRFVYSPQNPYSVYRLKITNLTGHRIHFKIRCNNSKSYIVNPFEQVLSDKQSIQIKFQFMPDLTDIDLKYRDKFQIAWGKVPYKPDQPTSLTQSKIFPVYLEQINPNEDFLKGIDSQKFNTPRSMNKVGASMTGSTPIGIGFGETNNYYQPQTYEPQPTLLTKYNLILVSVVSFILGYIFT